MTHKGTWEAGMIQSMLHCDLLVPALTMTKCPRKKESSNEVTPHTEKTVGASSSQSPAL